MLEDRKNIDEVIQGMIDSGHRLESTALLSRWQLDIRKLRNVIDDNSEAKPLLNELESTITRLLEDVEMKMEEGL
ncbi:hypothetical protein [Natranaerofaba carboxydovora]|uniref:hypothetical protein n=1 Tax=Natranaerofaba carboxydovora TaxID=2742683 RepID=UPI001F13AE53|nr:hypothetical protein [Natranaerofaba carboxydovora]UMZ73592.1 hypothetical protein ACONDI_01154 [Natranaerofaba carboxydovora]